MMRRLSPTDSKNRKESYGGIDKTGSLVTLPVLSEVIKMPVFSLPGSASETRSPDVYPLRVKIMYTITSRMTDRMAMIIQRMILISRFV